MDKKLDLKRIQLEKLNSKKKEIIIYFSIAFFCLITVIILSIVLGNVVAENNRIEQEFEARKKIYDELMQEQINIQDKDYAIVYYDENNVVIPNSNIIIEYTSK